MYVIVLKMRNSRGQVDRNPFFFLRPLWTLTEGEKWSPVEMLRIYNYSFINIYTFVSVPQQQSIHT